MGDQIWRRHTDQLLSSEIIPVENSVGESQITTDIESVNLPVLDRSVDLPVPQPVTLQADTAQSSTDAQATPSTALVDMPTETEFRTTSPPQKKYPRRQLRPPDRLSQDTSAECEGMWCMDI